MPLSSVKPSDVRSWTAKLRAEGLADSYVYALHARLSQVFSDAVHDGILAKSPCSRRTSPGAGKQRAYVATTEQVWALHDAMPEHLRAAVLLGAFAGLRLAETCGLRVSDIDFMRGVCTRPSSTRPSR
jgi:integrase